MSLVGNLEDLSLGDILQIISLSQKSGVLVLQSDQGSGRIVFQSGLVHAACVKGWPDDLRGILVGGGFIDPAGFDAASAHAADLGESVEEAVARESGLGSERIDALLREAVEAAILEMFVWRRGDFSFDVRTGSHPDDPQTLLPNGLNAQYLAMEGMRICDEQARIASGEGTELDETPELDLDLSIDGGPISDSLERPGEPMVAEEEGAGSPQELEPFSLGNENESDGAACAANIVVATVLAGDESEQLVADEVPTVSEGASVAREATESPRMEGPAAPVVVIDPDVSVLEWVKYAIGDEVARVHVFQQVEQGLARIRQYLVRGERPVVLLSSEAQVDPLSGIRGLADFVKRLKAQARGLRVLGLREASESAAAAPAGVDAVLSRPTRGELGQSDPASVDQAARDFSSSLADALATRRGDEGDRTRAAAARPEAGVKELREATARLREASTRGAILPVVLDFACDLFARVAILLVREGQVATIAGRGIPALEGNGTGGVEPMALESLRDGWLGEVLATRRPVHGAPATPADNALVAGLGLSEPAHAYLGPIESGGAVIALLYGDGSQDRRELPDTSGLEVVLHHAGLALDRAALERALAEGDASSA
jgi:hypothetical protein